MPGGHVTVGLWLESWMQPAWRARALRLLRERANIELTYVSVAQPGRPVGPAVNRLLGGLLGRLLERDHRRALRFSPDPFALEDVRPLLAGVPVGSDRMAPPGCDVVVQLGGSGPPAELAAARFGLWRFDTDPTHLLDGLPIGFWDVLRGRETVATALQVQRAPGVPGAVIHRRIGATALGSVALTAMHALWRQAGDLAIKLGQLAVLGPEVLAPLPQGAGAPALAVPGTLRTIALWARHAARVAGRRVSLFGDGINGISWLPPPDPIHAASSTSAGTGRSCLLPIGSGPTRFRLSTRAGRLCSSRSSSSASHSPTSA